MDFILDTLGKIGFDWRMGLFNLINFFIVYLILKKYAFGPIMKIIDERQEKMTQGVQNYEKSKTEIQMAERRAQDIIDEAKSERNKALQLAHVDAQKLATDMKEKAKSEIELLVHQAKRNIEIDKQDMRDALRGETATLALQAAEKIIGENMDSKRNRKLVETYLTDVRV
jgi:F-type H+-transporting ATPase subunit b